MSYEVGSHVDLTHINRQVSSTVQKKSSFQEAATTFFEVGTTFVFNQGKAARRIPISFA
jgi:hypothetical protein